MTESRFYEHAVKVYEWMDERSHVNQYEEKVFEGSLTEAFKDSGASTSWYTQIRNLLLSPDLDPCITIEQRGNLHQPSIVILRHPPPPEWGNLTLGVLTHLGEAATLHAEVEARVERLEKWKDSIGIAEVNIAEIMRNFEIRITRLESKTGSNGKDLNGESKTPEQEKE